MKLLLRATLMLNLLCPPSQAVISLSVLPSTQVGSRAYILTQEAFSPSILTTLQTIVGGKKARVNWIQDVTKASPQDYTDEEISDGKPWVEYLNHLERTESQIGLVLAHGLFFPSLFPGHSRLAPSEPSSEPIHVSLVVSPTTTLHAAHRRERTLSALGWQNILDRLTTIWGPLVATEWGPVERWIVQASAEPSITKILYYSDMIRNIPALRDVLIHDVAHLACHMRWFRAHTDILAGQKIFTDNIMLSQAVIQLARNFIALSPSQARQLTLVQVNGTEERWLLRSSFMLWTLATALDPGIYPEFPRATHYVDDLNKHTHLRRDRVVHDLLAALSPADVRHLIEQVYRVSLAPSPMPRPWLADGNREQLYEFSERDDMFPDEAPFFHALESDYQATGGDPDVLRRWREPARKNPRLPPQKTLHARSA